MAVSLSSVDLVTPFATPSNTTAPRATPLHPVYYVLHVAYRTAYRMSVKQCYPAPNNTMLVAR